MPSKFMLAVGMLALVNSSTAIVFWTTRSGVSLWKCGILGFAFASLLGLKTGFCGSSLIGGDVSFRIDSPTVTCCFRPWTGVVFAGVAATAERLASII